MVDTDSSGREVPIATTVIPIINGESLNDKDSVSDNFIKVLVENSRSTTPLIKAIKISGII
jgi:hypothetical protein